MANKALAFLRIFFVMEERANRCNTSIVEITEL